MHEESESRKNCDTKKVRRDAQGRLHDCNEMATEQAYSRSLQGSASAPLHRLHLSNTGGFAAARPEAWPEAWNKEGQDEEERRSNALKGLQMLPSCPVEARHLLPPVSAIYFLMNRGECVYVGKSLNLRQRWATHEKISEVDVTGGVRVAWMPTPDRYFDAQERTMIAILRPRHNYNLVPQPPRPSFNVCARICQGDARLADVDKLTTSRAAKRLGIGQSTVNLWCR